jgi:hypothetical protein
MMPLRSLLMDRFLMVDGRALGRRDIVVPHLEARQPLLRAGFNQQSTINN